MTNPFTMRTEPHDRPDRRSCGSPRVGPGQAEGVRHVPRSVPPEGAEAELRAAGLEPARWGNGPGETYSWHSHPYHKRLYCLEGSITFHTPAGDVRLLPGDLLEIAPGTGHAATVGPEGVSCVEAQRR